MLDESLPLLVVAPGPGCGRIGRLLGRARPRTFRCSPTRRTGAAARVEVPADVPEWLSPVTSVVAGQLWAHALTRARGLDPDAPRGLAKVTLTR
jgi:glucosamine--fructose-6-phosphate aminotransferase (isomerizing)